MRWRRNEGGKGGGEMDRLQRSGDWIEDAWLSRDGAW